MSRLAALVRQSITDPRPDGVLLGAFLADRDEAAFVELVRRHAPLVWGVCRRSLPDHADTEDAFQATFLVLVRRANRLTGSATVGPWLYKVAAWTAGNLRRKNARRLARRRELSDAIPDPRPTPEPPFDLDAALLALPERYRAALVLCCLEGLTHREAAGRLGCAEGTVSSLVSRGLAKLRVRLSGRDPATALAVAAAVLVPNSVSAVAARSAAAFRVLSAAAASPAVAELTEGVLRMFWLPKATAAGFVAAAVLTLGLGIGLTGKPAGPTATADPPKPKADPDPKVQELEQAINHLRAQVTSAHAKAEAAEARLALALKELEALKQQAGTSTVTQTSPGPGTFELIVGSDKAQHPYSFIERKAGGDAELLAYATTESALRRYLGRAWADTKPVGPLAISIAKNAPADRIKVMFAACRDAGFRSAWVTGEMPTPESLAATTGSASPHTGGRYEWTVDGVLKCENVVVDLSKLGKDGLPSSFPAPLPPPSK